MKNFIIIATLLLFISCKGNKDKQPDDDGFTTDTNFVFVPPKLIKDNEGEAFGHKDSLFLKESILEEAEIKRNLLYTAIDSTYAAIKEIEEIKNEMSAQTVGLSLTERNAKAKALMQLNKIGNALTRNIDSAVLVNLKLQTAQLELINERLDSKLEHFKELSDKLDRAGRVMERITDLLTLCVSRGIIKPANPPGKLPSEIKSNLN